MATSLLEWILDILRDPDARASFQHDPDDYAHQHGFGDLTSADVHDALWLIADNQSASWDDEHQQLHYPPPHHYDNQEHAGHYLNHYITNNYRIVDDHDTRLDNSVHQRVHTDGGDFHQTVDNDPVIASGDHAVAVGHDLEDSQVSSGNHNVVGDHDQVSGDHSTTSFGSGDASSADFDGAHFGSGSAVSVAGDAHGHATDDDTTTVVHSHGDAAVNVDGEQSTDQSHTETTLHSDSDDHSHAVTHLDADSHDAHITHL